MTAIAAILPWQLEQWQSCQQAITLQRVPQALLIKGAAGLGKLHFAQQLAAALLCEQRTAQAFACGHCHSCTLFQAETHPDFICIEPEEPGKVIGIEAIRSLLLKLALKPQYPQYRVVLFPSAELLNTASANAFLKCLEEPSERTVIIMVTALPERLPATIRSRCQQLHMLKPEAENALAWLQQHATAQPRLLLAMARGAPLLALDYAKHDLIAVRAQCFEEWWQVATHKQNPTLVAERWQKLGAQDLLDWLASWVADLIKCYYTQDLKLFYNSDLVARLQELRKRLSLQKLFAYYTLLLAAKKNCHTTLNKQLQFEAILIDWSELNGTD